MQIFITYMKHLLLIFLAVFTADFAFAQKVALAGNVNMPDGKPIPFAFIKDATHNYATYTDSVGSFSLKVDAADRLIVSAVGFKTLVSKVNDPQNISIALTANGSVSNWSSGVQDVFREKISTEGMTKNAATGYIAKEASLHGTRYFFDHWVHGFAITTDDSVKQDGNSMFNYGKIDGSVLFSADAGKMNEIDKGLVKSFTLFDDLGQAYPFEKVAAIDDKHFILVLASGSKYTIYKQLNTKFIPNNYVSNGMTSSGNNYDEIKDEPVYYAVTLPGGAPQKITLKTKALKNIFAADLQKVNKYLSDHDTDIDDAYLRGLGDYLNN
jgi:hypothetical protein